MMKSTKSPRIGPSQREHAARNLEDRGSSIVTDQTAAGLTTQSQQVQDLQHATTQSGQDARISEVMSGDIQDLEIMRRRMSEALAQQQQLLRASRLPQSEQEASHTRSSVLRPTMTSTESSSDESLASGTLSTDSAKTVRAPFDATLGAIRTPSYPFPRMQLRLTRGLSSRSGPSHKPFTLLSPTGAPLPEPSPSATHMEQRHSPSDASTPIGPDPSTEQGMLEDPNYPTPDLYDMVLMLQTEPGLDAWWANASEILSEAYGAERASLALPGDITDLENVPWGQKATFNIYGSDGAVSSNLPSTATSEADILSVGRRPELFARQSSEQSQTGRRPLLQTRHSIAGVLPESTARVTRQRPLGPVRANTHVIDSNDLPRILRQSPTPRAESVPEEPLQEPQDSSASATSLLRCYVHRSLQPLEAENDALLVRTGVSSLFGKRKPVILTRAYADEAALNSSFFDQREAGEDESTGSSAEGASKSLTSGPDPGGMKAFEEFEQPEPSPWSQSPSPSPAARPDPAESPFFAQPSTSIDEEAFEQNPPAYDYGASANQSLNAIGADMSKTLVHIPLIQPIPYRGALSSNLRFPVAILSFITSINPYPRNLRRSLAQLLPHLASSFSLAQQYSNLHDRIRGGLTVRHGGAFGLGGTFSDEGSELELVAELSGQIHEKSKSKTSSLHGSVYSPSDRTTTSRDSPPGSIAGTPLLDHLGMNPQQPPTPGLRTGQEMVDSYFSAKRAVSGRQAVTPGGRVTEDSPEHARRSTDRPQSAMRRENRKVTTASPKARVEPPTSSTRPSSTSPENDNRDTFQPGSLDRFDTFQRRRSHQREARDDGERPLPELISSLMLNSVPLQLFLAKPTSGDLVWTNRKFDAFRSQGEGRVRDPWKNVHSEDRPGLTKEWNEALKSGSQFTHYVRVKRFNSDSDFRWFVFRASTLLANNGQLLYWIGSFLDVHDQYMKNLVASEREATMARDAKIRALADAIPQVLFEAIEGEGIVSVNQQWQSFAGQTLEEAKGLGFARHVHKDDLHKCGILSPADVAAITRPSPVTSKSESSSSGSSHRTIQAASQKTFFAPDQSSLERMISSGSILVEEDENGRLSYSTEIRLRSNGGEYRWFLVRLIKVESALLNNGRASWYGTCTDIETRKNLERELNEANEKVHKEMENKTKFFANMSHEIRTPLNGILGSMPWLVESTLDHDQRRTVDTIQNSANNLRELVDNILDVTKVEAGKMTLIPKWFHVRSLVEEVIDTVSSRAIERGLELNYSLDADVPTSIRGDAFRVRQVLLNLLGNAVKFTEQGEVYLRCSLHHKPSTIAPLDTNIAFVAFEVTDTGRGFGQNDFQRLFKQFGQIGGGTAHDAGSGLGLFLSKQLVEMHGGELSVQSEPGEGSTFTFYVRVEVAAKEASTAISPATSTVTIRPGQQRSSVSFAASPRSRSENKTITMASSKGILQSPGLSRYVTSPEAQPSPTGSSAIVSPAMVSSESSVQSLRSNSAILNASSISSQIPTPESAPSRGGSIVAFSDRPRVTEKATSSIPALRRSSSDNTPNLVNVRSGDFAAHPATYSIIVICPAEHARLAIKQHIEQVIPHQIAANVTTIPDIGSFLELMHGPASPTFTHIVLDIPASSDIMLFMRQMSTFTARIIPALVVITDHYQKRDILDDFNLLTTADRKAFLVHKPVKPSVFAMIFDPAQLRNLSKDRAREVAQTSSDDFKNVANRVKENIGGRNLRILLVEDSDVNRNVIIRYFKKVDLSNDSAKDGQEGIDLVMGRPHGFYSLIICDIQMPRKNGYQACTEIRSWETENGYRPIPIMALTANAMPEERAAAGAAGFTDYLTKPVDFNHLGIMMMTLLDPRNPHTFLRDRPPES